MDRWGVIEQIVIDTPNTTEIAGHTIRLMKQYNVSPLACPGRVGVRQVEEQQELFRSRHYML